MRKYQVKQYQKESLEYLLPPEDLKVSEWAEKNRVLEIKTSAMPGLWKNDITPYLVDIMNEFNNYETEEIVFCKPTQVGGTEALNNMIGYIIDQDPSPTMIVYPTDKLAEFTSDNRLRPMIMASPSLKKKFSEKSKKEELQFESMYIAMVGSNSPSDLASRPIRILMFDEVDKYPNASKKEADPISLATERTKTFSNRKIYKTSTPTLKTGYIWQAKENADVERHYFVPCPHCGEYIELKFAQITWPHKEDGKSDAEKADQAYYVCQECGCIINDRHKPQMLRQGKWKDVRKNHKRATKVAFWINTLYSPFVKFAEIAQEFLKSKDDSDMLHNFVNSWLAEPWEDTKLKTNADLVMERQTEYEMYTVPPWAKLLTAGVDVQETCLYWTIRAWGDFLTSQNIAHGQAFSLTEIERIMNLEYIREDGERCVVNLCLIDSGDQTDEVYDFCAYNSEWALPCKGSSGNMLSHYKLSKVNKTDSRAFGMNLVMVDGGKYKDMIAARLQKPNGKGSWMVYKDCDREYAEQVTAEHKVVERNGNGKEVMKWVPKTTHADNHYLDAEVYALGAADVLGVRGLFLENQEEQEQTKPKERQQEEHTPEENWISQNENWLGG